MREEIKARRRLDDKDVPFLRADLYFFEDKDRKEGEPLGKFCYLVNIGSTIPPRIVEVDAMNGSILQWITYPR